MSAHDLLALSLVAPWNVAIFDRAQMQAMLDEHQTCVTTIVNERARTAASEARVARLTAAADRLHETLIELVHSAGPVIDDRADTETWNEAVRALSKARDVLAGEP